MSGSTKVQPAPSASRGEIVLQPAYFTSSSFIKALRDDINTLISTYYEQYTNTQSARPFTLFKTLWSSQGWKWMHFMVFDDRARDSFLNVTLRLFLERMAENEAPYIRVVALFGLYTFYFTQPSATAPPLHRVSNIPIPLDQYAALKALPGHLAGDYLLPFQPVVRQIVSTLLTDGVFVLVPSTQLRALSPRDLPREIFVDKESIVPLDPTAPKKKGRPTRVDKAKKAKTDLHNLDKWLENTSCNHMTPAAITSDLSSSSTSAKPEADATLGQYRNSKSQLLSRIDFRAKSGRASEEYTAFQQANQFVLDRLKATEEYLVHDSISSPRDRNAVLSRVERAVKETIDEGEEGHRGGILGLLEGGVRNDSLLIRGDLDALAGNAC